MLNATYELSLRVWIQFAADWCAERSRRKLPPTWNRLAVAIHRASGGQIAIADAIQLAQSCLRMIHETPERTP